MTDSLEVQECKRQMKIVIGEKEYPQFILRLASSIDPLASLELEYGLGSSVTRKWIKILGYRDGTTRRCLTMHYKRLRRIKERQKRNEKLTNFLFANNKKSM